MLSWLASMLCYKSFLVLFVISEVWTLFCFCLQCGVISPRFDVQLKDLEKWQNNLLPSRQFGWVDFLHLKLMLWMPVMQSFLFIFLRNSSSNSLHSQTAWLVG